MSLVVQFAGAIAILVPFVLLQAGRLSVVAGPYLAPNLGGSVLLTLDAWRDRQWGFVLVQVVWGLATAWAMAAKARRRLQAL